MHCVAVTCKVKPLSETIFLSFFSLAEIPHIVWLFIQSATAIAETAVHREPFKRVEDTGRVFDDLKNEMREVFSPHIDKQTDKQRKKESKKSALSFCIQFQEEAFHSR